MLVAGVVEIATLAQQIFVSGVNEQSEFDMRTAKFAVIVLIRLVNGLGFVYPASLVLQCNNKN